VNYAGLGARARQRRFSGPAVPSMSLRAKVISAYSGRHRMDYNAMPAKRRKKPSAAMPQPKMN
jgi:hypothetical protein